MAYLKTIASHSTKHLEKLANPHLIFNHTSHLTIVLDILRTYRKEGLILVPLKRVRKPLVSRSKVEGQGLKSSDIMVAVQMFLIEETERGSLVYGHTGNGSQPGQQFVKLVGA